MSGPVVAIFRSTREVIRAEALCRREELPGRIIPVPRSVSPLCGMAIELPAEEAERFRQLLEAASIPVETVNRADVSL